MVIIKYGNPVSLCLIRCHDVSRFIVLFDWLNANKLFFLDLVRFKLSGVLINFRRFFYCRGYIYANLVKCFEEWRTELLSSPESQPTQILINHKALKYFISIKQLNRR